MTANGAALNTDRELFREDTCNPAGSYYENSVSVSASGVIQMNVGGLVVGKPIAEWHHLAGAPAIIAALLAADGRISEQRARRAAKRFMRELDAPTPRLLDE
jgi:hypothetical protein